MMSYSLNETEALCKRAARGAALSWGMAAEAAAAARWLAALGLPGPELLAARLTLLDGHDLLDATPTSLHGTWQAAAGGLCPIVAGVAMTDCPDRLTYNDTLTMRDVLLPLLIVPFAGIAASDPDRPVVIEWGAVRLSASACALRIEGDRDDLMLERTGDLRCGIGVACESTESEQTRARVDTDTWNQLSAFAGRTYAPATEESRRLGAG